MMFGMTLLDYVPPFVLILMAILAAGMLYFVPAPTSQIKVECDTINRLVLDGKPYICHPMPEGTGHHD